MVVINDLASASRPATTMSTQQQWEALRQQDCFGGKHVAGSPGMAVKQAARRKQRNGSTGSNLIQYSLGQQGFKIDIVHIQRRFEQVALHFLLHPQVYLQIICRTDFGYEASKFFLRTLCCRATIGHLLPGASLRPQRQRKATTCVRSTLVEIVAPSSPQ